MAEEPNDFDTRLTRLEESVGHIERSLNTIVSQISTAGKTNWQLVISIISVSLILGGSVLGAVLMPLSIKNGVTDTKVDKVETAQREDREKLSHIETEVASLKRDVKWTNDVHNVREQEINTRVGIMWGKLYEHNIPFAPLNHDGPSK